ncbi:MAG: cytochrome c [Bacteroidia bacterium]|nr:cytochrome c [Bacteroidia bacterium]MBP9690090.1 cytochrome c [Bacteroidia bacterium]
MRTLIILSLLFFVVACMETPTVNMQAVAHGQELYETHCANCHQQDGKGLARIVPPLLNADYLTLYRDSLPNIIYHGMHYPIVVNGIMYQQKMPENSKLSMQELTAVINFVEFRFAKLTQLLSIDSVELLLRK